MTNQPNIEEIGRALPPAQRHALKAVGAFSLVVARRLTKRGLVSMYARQTGENYVRLELTPLGIQVRDYLRSRT